MKRILTFLAAAAVALGVLTGCSTVSTEPDQIALHYSGGSFSSKEYKGCIPVSKRDTSGPSESYFVYPDSASQRDFTADTSKADREADTITVNSKDGQELAVPMVVTFNLNSDCSPRKVDGKEYKGGVLQFFHERHANKRAAYWNADTEGTARADGAPAGWISLLQFGVGIPLDRAADRLARDYTVNELWTLPDARVKFETQLNQDLSALIDSQMGTVNTDTGVEHFFDNIKVSVGQPTPTNQALRDAVASEQAAIAQANAATKKAKADELVAQAEVAVARARAEASKAELDALGPDVWIRKYAIDHNINPWPAPVVAGTAAK